MFFPQSRRGAVAESFLPDAVGEDLIEKILEAAVWAPSWADNQPWDFIVITSPEIKKRIHEESVECKKNLYEKSGWGWAVSGSRCLTGKP